MANDFTQDPNCVAVWKFNDEVDAGIDSLGYNSFTTFTTFGSYRLVRDTYILREGESSLYINSPGSPGPRISDSDLNSNFPLKSTSIGSDFSFSIWFRFGVVDKFRHIWSKYYGLTYSGTIAVVVNNNNSITVRKKYSTSGEEHFTIPDILVAANIWYHLTVAYDYSEKTLYVYLINTSGKILASHTVVQNEDIIGSGREFRLGGASSSNGDYNVWYDEFVAFNRVISEAEAVLIARGQFPYAQPTTPAPTLAPTTLAPTTLAPTLAPTTLAPTTLAPTLAPTTLAPTTLAPTASPTTLAPTVAPTTISPTTVSPTTLSPTQAPTTLEPTTLAPTTLAPTTPFPGVYASRELNSFINEEDSLNSAINAVIDLNSYMDE